MAKVKQHLTPSHLMLWMMGLLIFTGCVTFVRGDYDVADKYGFAVITLYIGWQLGIRNST